MDNLKLDQKRHIQEVTQRARLVANRLSHLGQTGFSILMVVVLCTPNWYNGIFSWLPLWVLPSAEMGEMRVGLFTLLPLGIVTLWVGSRWLYHPRRPPFQWGPRSFWLPFAALSLLGLSGLEWPPTVNSYRYVGLLTVCWLVYFYLLNEQPRLTTAIGVVLLIQGAIAFAQFYLQHEVGLYSFGEPLLDLSVEGTSVVWARGRNWLRGYGLTTHPNILGAILSIGLLLYIAQLTNWSRWSSQRQILFLLVVLAGMAGLFLSFSRAAWLALAVGIVIGLIFWLQQQRPSLNPIAIKRSFPALLIGLLLILPMFWLIVVYSDLAFSRIINLESDIEARSISERIGSAEVALRLIADHPWSGVGLGHFVAAAQRIDPNIGVVHSVPLLVAAELGIVGLLLWLWLVVAPFWRWWRPQADLRPPVAQLAPWVAMLTMSLFDTTLWLGDNWQTAILFIILAAHLVWPINEQQQSLSSIGLHANRTTT